MKQTPKILLGVCASLILASLLFLIFTKAKTQSGNSLLLTTDKNKFKVAFQIKNQNQDELESILKSLNLPISAKDGIEFELDSTTSAKLAFLTPVKTSIDFSPKRISLEGTLDFALENSEIKPEPIKVPESIVFAVFAKDLSTIVKKQSDLSPATLMWLDENLTSNSPHYLVIFKNGQFALLFKNENINLDNLSEITSESSTKTYLLESASDLDNVKYPNNLLLFQIEPWNIITNSQESVSAIAGAQSKDSLNLDFASISEGSTFVSLFRNPQSDLSNEFLSALVGISESSNLNANKLLEALNNINLASFALKQDRFSALIVFK